MTTITQLIQYSDPFYYYKNCPCYNQHKDGHSIYLMYVAMMGAMSFLPPVMLILLNLLWMITLFYKCKFSFITQLWLLLKCQLMLDNNGVSGWNLGWDLFPSIKEISYCAIFVNLILGIMIIYDLSSRHWQKKYFIF